MAGFKIQNFGKTPTWFTRTKNALDILVDGAIVFLLALGHADSSLIMLILRIGYVYLMKSISTFLGEEKEVQNV